jgi:rSAM/selenodomain-associated transferase 2
MANSNHPYLQENLVSVIIPTLNEAKNISETLLAARRTYTKSEAEVILVDGGSTDGTLDQLPEEVIVVRTRANRAHQMNRGVEVSHGSVLLFCHGDTRLPVGWRESVLEALQNPQVSGGAFQSRLEPETRFLKLGNRVKLPRDWRFMYGDQCLFLRRSVFEQLGGYPDLPLMEDVELARGMARVGKLARINQRVVTDSRRMQEKGVIRQLVGNTWRMFRYLYLGATAQDIARSYQSSREERP